MKKVISRYKKWYFTIALVFFTATVYGQKDDGVTGILLWFPIFSFITTFLVGVLNLFVMNRINKIKDEILGIVRQEMKMELGEFGDNLMLKVENSILKNKVGDKKHE